MYSALIQKFEKNFIKLSKKKPQFMEKNSIFVSISVKKDQYFPQFSVFFPVFGEIWLWDVCESYKAIEPHKLFQILYFCR